MPDEEPELSVAVAVVSGISHLRRCLNSLLNQENPPKMEILVPCDFRNCDFQVLQSEFPEVQFPRVSDLQNPSFNDGWSREHLDELRARGVDLSRGQIVAFVEDHGRADSKWARKMIDTHRHSCAVVGGAIENEVDRILNWAVYFSDFGRYQNPLKEGPSHFASDVNISYKKSALEASRDVWKESFHETTVNEALLVKGETLWLSSEIVMYQHREDLNLLSALKERLVWGRSYAGIRVRSFTPAMRILYMLGSPILPVILIGRAIRNIMQKRRHLLKFLTAFPLILLLCIFWSLGEFAGYLSGSSAGSPAGSRAKKMKK